MLLGLHWAAALPFPFPTARSQPWAVEVSRLCNPSTNLCCDHLQRRNTESVPYVTTRCSTIRSHTHPVHLMKNSAQESKSATHLCCRRPWASGCSTAGEAPHAPKHSVTTHSLTGGSAYVSPLGQSAPWPVAANTTAQPAEPSCNWHFPQPP